MARSSALAAWLTLVLALALVTGSAAASRLRPARDGGPDFCRGLDCPNFSVLEAGEGWTLRSYPRQYYVATEQKALSYAAAVQRGFMLLFAYISGSNAAAAKVEMTAPVLTHVSPGQGPNCRSNFTVHFFVPFAQQANPPIPTNPQVVIAAVPDDAAALKVYVSSFGGWATDRAVVTQAEALVEALVKQGQAIDTDSGFYVAEYDPPFRLFNRHSEIWIPAAGGSQARLQPAAAAAAAAAEGVAVGDAAGDADAAVGVQVGAGTSAQQRRFAARLQSLKPSWWPHLWA